MDNQNNQPIPFVDEHPFIVWLSADDIKFLTDRANESGYDLVSDFIRSCLGFDGDKNRGTNGN